MNGVWLAFVFVIIDVFFCFSSGFSTLDGRWDVMCIADVLAWSLSMRPIFAVVKVW